MESEKKPVKASRQKAARKKAMLDALEKNMGIVSHAAKMIGVDRDNHYKWMKEDPNYKAAVDSIAETAIDFAESMLFKNMKGGDTTATIFYLKTKGRNRGYTEQIQHRIDLNVVNDKISGLSDEQLEQLGNIIENE